MVREPEPNLSPAYVLKDKSGFLAQPTLNFNIVNNTLVLRIGDYMKRLVKSLWIALFLQLILAPLWVGGEVGVVEQSMQEDDFLEMLQSVDFVVVYESNPQVALDGVIGPSEYADVYNDTKTNMDVYLQHNSTHLFVGLVAPTTGWVAFGVNVPGGRMINADVKMASVTQSGEVTIFDKYVVQYAAPPADLELGGEDDISAANGSNDGSQTIVEMIYPMATGDDYDYDLVINQTYDFLLAWALSPSQGVQHIQRHSHSMLIAPEFVQPRTITKLEIDDPSKDMVGPDDTFQLSATLTDNTNNPLANRTVVFFMKTLIGELELNRTNTDSLGLATADVSLYQEFSEDKEVYAKFLGDYTFRGAKSDMKEVSFMVEEEEESFPFQVISREFNFLVPWLTILSVVLILVTIWSLFGYVVFMMVQNIRDPGPTTDTEDSQ